MLSALWDLGSARTVRSRAITAENPTGGPGEGARAVTGTGAEAARDLGQGWKISPSIVVGRGASADLATIEGSGIIRHFWLTTSGHGRRSVLRAYWEGSTEPAVEVPLGDFFCNGWAKFSPVMSLPIVVAPNGGMNSYWQMPFKSAARLSIENIGDDDLTVYYQVDYTEQEVPGGAGYFHARWQRENPVGEGSVHQLLSCSSGPGLYCGTYLAVGANSPGWWGEGEMKFYLDDDTGNPTICGTGTEDYFGGAWNFDVPGDGYTTYSSPFLGLNQVLRPDGLYNSQQRFGMYRWHVLDPISFGSGLRVTIQDLGWHEDRRYRKRHDDMSSMVTWYHALPALLPGRVLEAKELEV
ncbi:MAG TPA: glycoside hydrolase family 172 protein [Acidimicrobiales bacterium]|nr:glycoside hydrolase family 172 protein [Acidimicrobiales bacterium]